MSLQGLGATSHVHASANTLFVNQSCTDTASVTFSWQGSDPSARQVWIDLSIFDNGFAPRSFIGAGPFSGSNTSFTWSGLKPSMTHYVRINQQMANGAWDTSPTWVFTTCGATTATPPAARSQQSSAQAANQAWIGSWCGTWSGAGSIKAKWTFSTATATSVSGTYDAVNGDTGAVINSQLAVTYKVVNGTTIPEYPGGSGNSTYTQSFQMSSDGSSITATRKLPRDTLYVTATRC